MSTETETPQQDWKVGIENAENIIVCASKADADHIRGTFPFQEFQATAVVVGHDPLLRTHVKRDSEVFVVSENGFAQVVADWIERVVHCFNADVHGMDGGQIVTALGESPAVKPTRRQSAEMMSEAGVPAPAAYALPAVVYADAFLEEPLPDPVELIAGVLHKGSKMVLGGSSKSYKTWTLLNMAIAVASGTDWLGFATARAKVLYINLEIQPRFMQKRIAWVKEAKGLKDLPNLAIWNLRGHCADIARLAPQIIAQALSGGFDLIIIDPIYKVGGDRVENATEGVADMANELEKIAVRTEAAIVFGAHFSKGNQTAKESMDRISGSGVFARDPDSILTFTAHEMAGAFTVEPILRNFPPLTPFVVKWECPQFVRDADLDPSKLKKPKTGRESIYAVSDILDCLGTDEMKTGALQQKTMDDTGMSKGTFHALLKRAKQEGKLSKSKITDSWGAVQ